jgi:DNA invertase Pin-like site-specific DNA recombinase
MLQAIAYLRTSTRDQLLGLEAQRADIAAWAAREGVEILAWHEDKVSGTASLEDRPGLLAALAGVKAHKAAFLLVQKRDRLARDAVEAGLIERAVGKLGAVVRASDAVNEPESPTTKLVNGILDNVAAFEGAQIRARIKAALRAKKAKGEKLGGLAPYGTRLGEDGRTLVPNAEEQAIIEEARALRASGVTIRGVAATLATRGMLSRVGRPFGVTQIVRLLAA